MRDEEGTVLELARQLRARLPGDHEVVFVDDGSRDGTREAIQAAVREDGRVRGLVLRRAVGKGGALAAGFDSARGAVVVTLDGDLQDDPAEVAGLLGFLEAGADVAVGWRRPRHDPWTRRAASWLVNALLRGLTGVPVHDVNCGLKAFRREVLDALAVHGGLYRFLPVLAHGEGFRVQERPVHHGPRRAGRSKYGAGRIPPGLLDLLTVLFIGRFRTRPAHLFGLVGGASLAAGALIGAYLGWLRWTSGAIFPRYPLLALGVLLAVLGVQSICTGLLAELVAYHARRGTREYRVHSEIRAD
ncbi:MAG: glycosyltransferase family 2 protein [Planctomycetes bacterium]|nr:glycosyltransferase family 2 protein [Planctomycetota bacterium]